MTLDGNAVQDLYIWYTDAHGGSPSTSVGNSSHDCSLAVQSSYNFFDGSHLVAAAGDDSPSNEADYYQPVLPVHIGSSIYQREVSSELKDREFFFQ